MSSSVCAIPARPSHGVLTQPQRHHAAPRLVLRKPGLSLTGNQQGYQHCAHKAYDVCDDYVLSGNSEGCSWVLLMVPHAARDVDY